ncbi:hypothetical protein GALMADRAFT_140256 [Galerina marginata CBS 339.88]|uniref:F-box domain-containing protein n=1 Tax=Galerina marginata (strain CBS 339.88) TaxID=685588 RepID=A0A067SXG0_GALM3|nr:hypothetical protein GALMADRAFT_140256 [Galerina marginata CBS 339.88]
MDSSSPHLPQDLERLVFEMVALEAGSDIKSIAKLLPVAKRVCEWIRPILYNVFLLFKTPRFPAGFPNFVEAPDLLDDVGRFAKHLFIRTPTDFETVNRLLSSCPNVQNIAIWCGSSQYAMNFFLPALCCLPLKRLSSYINHPGLENFNPKMFSNLTHLDIVSYDGIWKESIMQLLANFPKLTHLALPSTIDMDTVGITLRNSLHLRIVILIAEEYGKYSDEEEFTEVDDQRLILMISDDYYDLERNWENGARGGVDFWIDGERFSIARRAKFLLDASQRWIHIPFPWHEELNDQGKEWYSGL